MFLAGAEVLLRALFPKLAWEGAHLTWEGGADLKADTSVWPSTYPRDARGVLSYIEFSVPVSFNADGFRDADFQPGARRVVLFLGDSSTEGHGVRIENTFVSLLRDSLDVSPGGVTTWNAARSGTATVDQARILDRIFRQHPDADIEAVVLATCASPQAATGNDLVENADRMPFLVDGRPGPQENRIGFASLVRRSAILHGWECLISNRRRRSFRMPAIPRFDDRWSDYCACLDRIRALCEQRGASLLIACLDIYPSDGPDDIAALDRRFRAYAADHAVPFVMCAPQVSSLASEQWFYPIDGHPNDLGHRYIASQLQEPLRRLLADRSRQGR